MIFSIKHINNNYKKILNSSKNIKVKGWVKSIRYSKNIIFISIKDGSDLSFLQLVIFKDEFNQLELINNLNFSSFLMVEGILIDSKGKQNFELKIIKIDFLNVSSNDYPLQKKNIPLETIRDHLHLRSKTNFFFNIFRLRHFVSKYIHYFFDREEFYYVNTPILTSTDAEGAGEFFEIKKNKIFPDNLHLTVSAQLQAECLVQGLGKVYTFSPCFRAENSNTTRHLSEFWMIEPEIFFTDLISVINLAEKLIKEVIFKLLENNKNELFFLESYLNKKIIDNLKKVINISFKIIDYRESLKILRENKSIFDFKNFEWGVDLKSEHEKFICKYFDSPVFIINYPSKLKAFYMKDKEDGTVSCFDLLVPEIGELIGGSIREDNYEKLKNKIKESNISNLSWYLNLRNYGYSKSGGFGLGLERLMMYITGVENIRDVIPFPRYPDHFDF